MKTSKRLLSLFLAVVMALTACSVGFVAFAQEVNPKDNLAFNDKNASKKGSVEALTELVDEFLPDILKLIGEQTLAGVGVSIDKVTNASFDDSSIKSDRFYELMLELSPKLNSMLGGASRSSILADTGFTWGYDVLDSRFYACLEDPKATIDFWTLYDLCSKNADQHGNEFQKLCYDYLNGYKKDGKDVMGLHERMESIFNLSLSVDPTQATQVLADVVTNLQLDPDKAYTADEIQTIINSYEKENGPINNEELPVAYKIVEYYLSLAGLNVKVDNLATALLYANSFSTSLLAGVFNRFANDGGADFSALGITGKLDFSNWETQLRKVDGNKDLSLSELAAYYLGLFFDGSSLSADYSANILDGMSKYYGASVIEEDIQNSLGSVDYFFLYDSLTYVLKDDFNKFAYNHADYPFDNQYLIDTVNGKINGYAKMVEDLESVVGFPGLNNMVDGILSHLTRTAGPNKEKLSTKYIAECLTDVYINLAKDPVSTISNLAPLITILVDEVVLPLVFNQKGDAFGSQNPININTIVGLVFSKEQIAQYGIGKLELNLNRIIPDLLNYIQGTADPVNGYHDKDKKIPNILNIKAVDELIGQHLHNYKFLEEINVPAEYKPVVKEAVKYVIPALDKAVDSYLNGNKELGIAAHKDDATIAKEMLIGVSNVTMGRGLNNISIALPTILDILGKMIIADQGIDSDWEFANRVVYGDKVFISGLAKKYQKVENATVNALKTHAFDEKPDASNVTGWIVDFVLSTLGNSVVDLLNSILTTDNNITKNIPIISAVIDSIGGFTDLSLFTDVLNGAFGLTRDSKYSFSFADRNVPYSTNNATYNGLSEDSVYYLIANVAPLVRSIMGIVEANKQTPPANGTKAPYAENGSKAAVEVKLPNFDSVLTKENVAASKELLSTVDEVLATLLAKTELDGFAVDNATGVLSSVVTFLNNHLGKEATDELMTLLLKYLDVINANNTNADGSYNGNSDGTVNTKKVFSEENLSTLVKETYVLLENIVDTMLPTVINGDISIITGAIKGVVSPGSVAIRSDALSTNKKLTATLSWKDVNDKNLGYNFKAGDTDAFFTNLYDSLGAVSSILGAVFCATGYYENVFAPIFNSINNACGINALPATAANGEEVLLAFTHGGADLLNKLLAAPATTLVSIVSGLSNILQDKNVKPIILGAINPIIKEINGIKAILKPISPSLVKLISKNPIISMLPMIPGMVNAMPNIVTTLVNMLAGKYVKLPEKMPWDKFANAKPEEMLLMIYAMAKENGLLNDLPVTGEQISALLATVNKLFTVLGSTTEAYWVFDHYIGKAASKFTFPNGITQSDADKAIDQLDNLVANVFPLLKQFGVVNQNSLADLLSDMLYTNNTLTSIATAIYGALEPSVKMFTPAFVANYLTDSSYGATYKAAAKTLKDAKSWADVKSLNWGFSDGSAKAQQGFINGLAAIFRPFNDLASLLLAEGSFDVVSVVEGIAAKDFVIENTTANGLKYKVTLENSKLVVRLLNTAVKGAKENIITVDLNNLIKLNGANGYESAIIPVLEAFMCDNVKTYDQYLKDYKKNKDVLLTNILNPLFGFVNKLAAAPFDTLTAVLPNVAYFIDNNGVAQVIDNLLSPVTKSLLPLLAEQGIDVDQIITDTLGTDLGSYVANLLGVNVKLNIKLANLSACNIQDIVLPLINKILADNNLKIVLPNFDWATLASHGKQLTVKSAARNSDGDFATIRIVANQGETLVAVLRYISQTLISNSTAIKNIITSIDGVKGNKTIVDVLNCVFTQIKTADKDDVVRAIFYFLLQEPQNRFFDYRNFQFKEYDFTYPDTIDMQFLNVLAPMVDGILTGVLGQFVPGGLPGLVTNNIYKDDIINALVNGIYGSIEKVNIDKNTKLIDLLAMTDIDFTAAHFAELLTDKAYGKSYDNVAKVVANAGSWSKLSNTKLAWGVTDRDSFLHALSAALRPMYGVLDVLLNDGALGLFDLVYIPGSDGYTSTIVPLMEAFGLYNIKTQYQYREDMSKEYDAILLDILNPLLDKVEDILNAPIQLLTDILPNLALFFANDGLLQLIENLMTPLTALLKTLEPIVNVNDVLSALGIDVSKELAKLGISGVKFDIYDLTATLKPVIGAENIVGVLNGVLKKNNIAIELMPIDWYQLASHGTLVANEASQAATFGSRMYVKADSNETLVAVLRYLINTVNYKDNFTVINNLITGMLGSADASIADVVNQVLGMLQGETDVVLSDLCGLLQTFA